MNLRSLLLATTSVALLVTGIAPIASAAPTTTDNNTTKLSATPPDPTVMMTVAKRTEVSKSGRLLVRGTYSCADAKNKTSELGGSVSQWRGQTQVIGSFSITPLECDGVVHHWSPEASNPLGDFAPGQAKVSSYLQACGLVDCGTAFVIKKLAVGRADR